MTGQEMSTLAVYYNLYTRHLSARRKNNKNFVIIRRHWATI